MRITMYTDIFDPIIVALECGGSPRLRPLWFTWRGRKVPVKSVTYSWEGKEGRAALYFFAVNDSANNVYELCLNADTMGWRLQRVYCEG
jgi:hypothetical protein